VEAAEVAGGEEGEDEDACADDGDLAEGVEVEVGDADEEEVGEGEVERAPEDVDGGGGETLAGWFGEGALEGAALETANEVGDSVDEEGASEEEGDGVGGEHGRAFG